MGHNPAGSAPAGDDQTDEFSTYGPQTGGAHANGFSADSPYADGSPADSASDDCTSDDCTSDDCTSDDCTHADGVSACASPAGPPSTGGSLRGSGAEASRRDGRRVRRLHIRTHNPPNEGRPQTDAHNCRYCSLPGRGERRPTAAPADQRRAARGAVRKRCEQRHCRGLRPEEGDYLFGDFEAQIRRIAGPLRGAASLPASNRCRKGRGRAAALSAVRLPRAEEMPAAQNRLYSRQQAVERAGCGINRNTSNLNQ